jgi:hypothetical protein
MEESMLKFARCMREHGVDVPDPKPGEGIRIGGPGSKIDPEDPSFQKAQKACEGLMRGAIRSAGGDGDDGGTSENKDADG